MQHGFVGPRSSLEESGLGGFGALYCNQTEAALVEMSVARGEVRLAEGGAVVATTGAHTGRSPKDKHIVRSPATASTVWWDNNRPMTPEAFALLEADMRAYMQGREGFVQDLHAGADPAHRFGIRVVTEFAWHALFIRHLLRRPTREELAAFEVDWTILNCPGFRADPARHGCRSETVIAFSFERRLILICNTAYAGENKKAVFTLLNYLLPERGVLPMHCSANHAPGAPDDAAVFFGLSGTGKTTLSADPARVLLGDDEHGWSDAGLFNFEGGCYAKTIHLSAEAEPEIHATTRRFATVIENMVFDPETRALDFEDASLTENMRAAYPLEAISNASASARAGHPRHV
ncbi:MAG: hypothetical protein RL123_516, partial [Pseudomonadota bacterium]